MNQSRETILLVEDDPYCVKLIQRAIQKARLANPIQTVSDGEAAIAYLSGEAPYDDRERHPFPVLMFLDLKLPKKDGFEVLTWVRAQRGTRRLPVVVLTSTDQAADMRRSHELGATACLAKPIGPGALVDLLKTVELHWLITNTKSDRK